MRRTRDVAATGVLAFALSCCGGQTDRAPDPPDPVLLATGTHLAVLGIEGEAIYAVDSKTDDSLPMATTSIRGLRLPTSGSVDEIGTTTWNFFHAAAIWNSQIITFGAGNDAVPGLR